MELDGKTHKKYVKEKGLTMKYLQYNWKSRVFVILIISIIASTVMVALELTDWAEQINQQGYSHGSDSEGDKERANIAPALMYILPFVKEIVLIGVPMLLTLLILKLSSMFKSTFKRKKA